MRTRHFLMALTALATALAVVTGCVKQNNKLDPPEPAKVAVTGVTLNKSNLKLEVGKTQQLTATISPDNATEKGVTWSSSDDKVVSVSSSGLATAVGEGNATVTVTTKDGGKTAVCKFEVVAAAPQVIAVTGVTLNKSNLKLEVGKTQQLKATVEPENATNKEVTWSSSDEKVVTVDDKGLVKAVGAGNATVTVTTKDGEKTAVCKFEVTAGDTPSVAVTGVRLDKTKLTLVEGYSKTLVATVSPEDATNKDVTWSTSDAKVATVDDSGKVTGVKEGKATITVTTDDGGKTATCEVTVEAAGPGEVAVTDVRLDKTKLTLTEGASKTLVATVVPEDATNKNVKWTSSKPEVATVDQDGKVTAVKEGQSTIKVTTEDGGKSATCVVTVEAAAIAVTGVKLDRTKLTLTVGYSKTLVATVSPEDASNKDVTWKSSKTSVATVDQNGKVTAVKAGTAKITVTTADGDHTATCNVTVEAAEVAVSDVSLDKSSLTMDIGGTYTLKATVTPSDATNQNVSFKSSDESVATVDQNGKVTGVKEGSATITVTTEDGSYTATCSVTVKEFSFWRTKGYGGSSMNTDPYSETYILGSNTYDLGDAMQFYVDDGTAYTYYDSDESHYSIQVLSNDGCIEVSKETDSGKYYLLTVYFKKNGKASVRLKYDNGEGVSITKDVNFNVYQDGSKKWKFRIQDAKTAWADYTGGSITTSMDKVNTFFMVTDLSGNAVEDLKADHYSIEDHWGNGVVEVSKISQTSAGNNYYLMRVRYKKADTAYLSVSYTDGTSLLTKTFHMYIK